jgi:hypothetical protein
MQIIHLNNNVQGTTMICIRDFGEKIMSDVKPATGLYAGR